MSLCNLVRDHQRHSNDNVQRSSGWVSHQAIYIIICQVIEKMHNNFLSMPPTHIVSEFKNFFSETESNISTPGRFLTPQNCPCQLMLNFQNSACQCFGQEITNHCKSQFCQICGCISIPTQSLDCQNLITPPAQGSLTGRFLTLKSNPEIRWLNLIYVDFMRAGPLSPWHSSKHRAKASSLQSWNLLFERFNYLKKSCKTGLDWT